MEKPSVERLPAGTPVEKVLEVLDRDGGVVITNLISQETLAKIAEELKPHEQPDQEWSGAFFPEATKRICSAMSKSQTYAKEIFLNPLYQEVCNRTLTITKKSRYGDEIRTFVCRPIGNTSTTFDIGPGAEAQQLHRDDGVNHVEHPTKGPTLMNMLVAQTRTTPENGATVVVPGSHKWVSYYDDRFAKPEQAIPVCLDPGDALIFDGALIHGGGANVTKSERRKVLGAFMVQGNLRSEENIFLHLPPEVAKDYPNEALEVYGYKALGSGLGWVNYREPLDAVLGRGKPSPGSLDFNNVGITA
ncbi:hypothetical protein A1O1_07116 [Capronia coronata CBS 617.96]|uniref:Phytanoyl-CoA dioxygenase n=1 Tax=Capronia coronata CBS 617.96 TaxID=1182541 RepID=W9XTF1_9EURO|nr:uncharacterized protein A1O1_07116 [Capronia coronata CBS 617.96]EXJ83493.1 hypothetical protein A1O1_07116 [Capronia coronata CBS 617.96]